MLSCCGIGLESGCWPNLSKKSKFQGKSTQLCKQQPLAKCWYLQHLMHSVKMAGTQVTHLLQASFLCYTTSKSFHCVIFGFLHKVLMHHSSGFECRACDSALVADNNNMLQAGDSRRACLLFRCGCAKSNVMSLSPALILPLPVSCCYLD